MSFGFSWNQFNLYSWELHQFHPYQRFLFNVITNEKLTPETRLEQVNKILKAIKEQNDIIKEQNDLITKEHTLYENLKQELNVPELSEQENPFTEKKNLISMDFQNRYGETLLQYAIEKGYLDIVITLLNANADPTIAGTGNSPLYSALNQIAYHNDPKFLKILMETKKINLNEPYDKSTFSDGATPLIRAVSHLGLNVVKQLLSYNADPTIANKKGEFPIDIALKNCQFETFELLLREHLAARKIPINLEFLLLNAAENGYLKFINVLIESKANIEIEDKVHQSTPLAWAAYNGYLDCVERFIKAGCNINAINKKGQTILEEILSNNEEKNLPKINNKLSVVSLLLENKANVRNVYDLSIFLIREDQSTPELSYKKSIIKNLYLNLVNNLRLMDTMNVAYFGRLEFIDILLNAKADFEIPDIHGSTPLAWAAFANHKDCIQRLIEVRSDINATNKKGQTILEEVVSRNEEKVSRENAFEKICNENKLETISLLLRNNAVIKKPVELYEYLKTVDQRSPYLIFCLKALINQQLETEKENKSTRVNQQLKTKNPSKIIPDLLNPKQVKEAQAYLAKLTTLYEMLYKESGLKHTKESVLAQPLLNLIDSYSATAMDNIRFFQPNEIDAVLKETKKNIEEAKKQSAKQKRGK